MAETDAPQGNTPQSNTGRFKTARLKTGETVAIILKGYPRLSETFIAQEIRALERRGIALRLYSLRHPTDPAIHPVHREIEAPVTYLPEYLKNEPRRVWHGWMTARKMAGFPRAWRAFVRDLRRDPTANRLRRFGQACVLATALPAGVVRLHAHFLHTPASVARYAALITGLPWSGSAHAKDIWTTPDWEIREKLADAEWLVTCTESGRAHLAGFAPPVDSTAKAEKVTLVYHGLDFSRFPPPPGARPARDGGNPERPVILLSVGRAVEKKGYDILLDALARLPQTLHWRLVHIGGGALMTALKLHAGRLGLTDRIEWLGAQPQEVVIEKYRQADLFVLASRIADDGDRDGLPNVLMEAQSQGLACLATSVSAIPELIEDDVTGVLVPPENPAVLAFALCRLIQDPALRQRLGHAGLNRVTADFAMTTGIDILAARLMTPKNPVD